MTYRNFSSSMFRFSSILAIFMLLVTGCAGKKKVTESNPDAYKVGLVFDVGGRGDKSFNDSAYNGLELAKQKLGIQFDYIEPSGEGADREAALRQMAADPDIKLIIGVGLLFTDDITALAKEFPDKKFACIDYNPQPAGEIPSNLSGIVFEEKKGSFLAGALAALESKTGTIGFIGGMDSNIIRKFESGYLEGARYVKPDIKVITNFIGMTGSAFNDPAKGKELALGQYSRGADIIYQASGASGMGVIEAARESNKLVICTDMALEWPAPANMLTSINKAVNKAVLTTIDEAMHGKFEGGKQRVFGLDDRYTDYVWNSDTEKLIDPSVRERIESIRKDILGGKIRLQE
ncbi:BMP family ABC transporter substrate-binding protein [Chlorobaculum sp. 24CR]|uniref:BMP family lipoprotein n=1 Tax=Chlorobaculum sp. 24CR TaxID=2508878 RepID=UPI00100C031B|nr:BMP family ABC transporter substrate-binding protein [Chlorobaculum sp. 24CR]RXK85180.1 BMP family ABC transporter substrate-binding protein [Chlorobaculum sp. 24CR]